MNGGRSVNEDLAVLGAKSALWPDYPFSPSIMLPPKCAGKSLKQRYAK